MAITYSVLYGQRGMKTGFRSKANAYTWAQKKATNLNKRVEIDKISYYPKAKVGQTDWSQKHEGYAQPRTKTQKKVRRRTPQRSGLGFNMPRVPKFSLPRF